MWLKFHNRLYVNILLDPDIMSLYPENDILPSLSSCVIEDNETQVREVFEEETAGFQPHPATLLFDPDESSDMGAGDDEHHSMFLEKMGVSNPECVKLSGRTFTAVAIRNLMSNLPVSENPGPDMIVHRSSRPVDEYNNPDLFPGMFPTLFPYGIGGFESKDHPIPLSFQQQAQYYLNLPDRRFHYHHLYIFIAWNIIQRRLAHLHTHFTCRRSHFRHVAHSLTTVSSVVLNKLANNLECECRLMDLSNDK